jgi:AcrR family transcriptional regulator
MARGRPRTFDTDKALDAALGQFWRHGYEGTSLAMLTEAAGVNVPSLYAAFGNKESLFRKAVERYLQGPASYLPKACQEPTARAVVESLFRGAIEMAANRGHADGCLLVQGALVAGAAGETMRAELAGLRAAAEAAVRRRLARARGEGDLPGSADPAALARYLMTVIWGLSVQAAGGATRRQLEEVAEMAVRCFEAHALREREPRLG